MNLFLFLPYLLLLAVISCELPKKPDVDKLFKDGQSATQLIKGNGELIVLVGVTGTGKSTLSKFLRKDETLTVVENEQMDCIFTDNETRIGSLDSMTSKTFFPNTDLDLQTGLPIVDMAGFRDTRSAEYDLVAAFFNKKILDGAKKMKIVIVENYSNVLLNNDRLAFITTFRHLAHLLKGNIESFGESISLVVTKVYERKNDVQTIRAIKVFLGKTEEHLNQQMISLDKNDNSSMASLRDQILLVHYVREKGSIAIFRRPDEVQSPWQSEPLRKNYEDIRNLIFNRLNFSKSFSKDFEVSVAPETVIYIRDNLITTSRAKVDRLFKMQYEKLADNFDVRLEYRFNRIEDKVDSDIKYCNNLLEFQRSIDNFNELEALNQNLTVRLEFQDELELETQKLLFFYQVAEQQNLAKISAEIDNMLGRKQIFYADVQNAHNFMKFLQSLMADFELYSVQSSVPSNWYKYQSNLTLFINYLCSLGFSYKPIQLSAGLIDGKLELASILRDVIDEFKPQLENFTVDGNTIIFSGKNVVLSRISETISKYNRKTHQIVIIATKKLFIDCDLSLQDTHLAMIAPVIEVVEKERTIKLTGSSGNPFDKPADSNISGLSGANGQNGNDGFSSGELKIMALEVKNVYWLFVKSTGGSGSDGQSGGNGFSSNSVSYPNDLSSFFNYGIYREFGVDRLIGYQYHLNVRSSEGTKFIRAEARGNGTASNGGNGGNGGAASGAGSIDFLLRRPEEIRVSSKYGAAGFGGKGGLAGEWHCLFKEFICKREEFKFFLQKSKIRFHCHTDSIGYCGSVAENGSNGEAGGFIPTRYKFSHLGLRQLVTFFWSAASKIYVKAEFYPKETEELWKFISFTNGQ
ncbi:uncharacterized protein LOC132204164 [Neocloeon triangulifer]|uniref:uncharacterized protein LOC132204164 n=1 Tax=Neocloeon triangulifer TaxID=2078957 RepID=UPI00286FAC13|nr:uncharacterized protein LOC132204164 [Neocloeon triangulifer]